jgi:ATP-dependent exoDNAse (exonuclease V) alpha subunit
VIPVATQSYVMLLRNLIYTAVTREKAGCARWTEEGPGHGDLQRSRAQRFSGLLARLKSKES